MSLKTGIEQNPQANNSYTTEQLQDHLWLRA